MSREGRSEPESVVLRRSEGGKMADRFSRFNEDRDFQVNTGVSEDPPEGSPRARGLRLPASALCPPALCSALQTGSLFCLSFLQGPPSLR